MTAGRIAPLRRDVRRLGALLGRVLAEREGREFFDLVEGTRRDAVARRRGGPEGRRAGRRMERRIAGLPVADLDRLARAFTLWFRLVNLAEDRHRLRRRAERAADPAAPPLPGTLDALAAEARAAGVPLRELLAPQGEAPAVLVLTAHPTDAVRRSVRRHLRAMAALLEERDAGPPDPRRGTACDDALLAHLEQLWDTEEVPRDRPTVEDEIGRTVEILRSSLAAATVRLRGTGGAGGPLADLPSPVRFGSWVGGDMDGNPHAGPASVRAAARAHEAACVELHVAGLARLRDALTGDPGDDAAATLLRRAGARLVSAPRGGRRRRDPGARALLADLRALEDLLHRTGRHRSAETFAAPVRRAVEDHGFHLAALDLRLHAREIRDTVADLLDDPELARAGDGAAAARALASARAATPRAAKAAAAKHRSFGALAALREESRRLGDGFRGVLAVSHTECPADILAAALLVRLAGLPDLPVVPLLESTAALSRAPELLRAVLDCGAYGKHVRRSGGVQEILLGYSDGSKDGGAFRCQVLLRRAQVLLLEEGARAGVPVRFFHGRGGTVSRGGGPLGDALRALPPGADESGLRVTEQGEVLHQRYGNPELARIHLERIVVARAERRLRPGGTDGEGAVGGAVGDDIEDDIEDASLHAERAWRDLVGTPGFVPWFEAVTPLSVVEGLPLGSRPARRRGDGGDLSGLRAIPWVFSWTQSRFLLPAWYGLGTGLARLRRRLGDDGLRRRVRGDRFLRTLLENAEMALAKSDMDVARRHASLAAPAGADPGGRFLRRVLAEHRRAEEGVRVALGARRLLDRHPVLRRSIDLRNPYVDPLSFLQVELLRRARAGDASPEGERALRITVAGIAAGLRNTG